MAALGFELDLKGPVICPVGEHHCRILSTANTCHLSTQGLEVLYGHDSKPPGSAYDQGPVSPFDVTVRYRTP